MELQTRKFNATNTLGTLCGSDGLRSVKTRKRGHGSWPAAILSLLLCIGLLSGCTVDETKSDGDRTDRYLVQRIHDRYLTDFYRLVQAANFFRHYQTLINESDTTGARRYVAAFLSNVIKYDRPYELDMEHFSCSTWGTITAEEGGDDYTAVSYSYDREYRITFQTDSLFTFSRERATDETFPYAEFDLQADVAVTGHTRPIEISDLEFNYSESVNGGTLELSITGGDKDVPLKCYLCYGSVSNAIPDSGTLHFTVTGTYSDDFTLKYYGDLYDIISSDGSTLEWYTSSL